MLQEETSWALATSSSSLLSLPARYVTYSCLEVASGFFNTSMPCLRFSNKPIPCVYLGSFVNMIKLGSTQSWLVISHTLLQVAKQCMPLET